MSGLRGLGQGEQGSDTTSDLHSGNEYGTADESNCRMDDFEESCRLDDGEGGHERGGVIDGGQGAAIDEVLDALCKDNGPSCATCNVVRYQIAVFGGHGGGCRYVQYGTS